MPYKTSPIKRRRRTKAQIDALKSHLYDIVEGGQPMTVRQVFYQAVNTGLIDKTEGEYKTTICRLLSQMRLEGDLPFGWIADNTRWMRKPRTHSSLQSMLELTASSYRRALWDDQPCYVEIWLEKDALSGVIYEITAEWDVPLMVTRGYSSLSFLHDAAEYMNDEDREIFIYYFGDWDPSGVGISHNVEDRLREFAPEANITFERVAILPEQIEALSLPTRPTKKTDTRSKSFKGESVELDAIPPETLRQMVSDCITQHIDHDVLGNTLVAEKSERMLLDRWDEILEGHDGGPHNG